MRRKEIGVGLKIMFELGECKGKKKQGFKREKNGVFQELILGFLGWVCAKGVVLKKRKCNSLIFNKNLRFALPPPEKIKKS